MRLSLCLLLLLALSYTVILTKSYWIVPSVPSRKSRCFIKLATEFSNDPNEDDFYTLERVACRRRYYDLLVFRYRNTPLDVYMNDHPRLDKEEALRRLTWAKCDEHGQDVWFSSATKLGLLSQWAIVLNDSDTVEDYPHGGVIGAVDGLLRQKREGTVVDLRNLRVSDAYRRRGLASRLIDAVLNFAQDQPDGKVQVTLTVDRDNHGARALYQKKGFVVDPTNDEHMTWRPKETRID